MNTDFVQCFNLITIKANSLYQVCQVLLILKWSFKVMPWSGIFYTWCSFCIILIPRGTKIWIYLLSNSMANNSAVPPRQQCCDRNRQTAAQPTSSFSCQQAASANVACTGLSQVEVFVHHVFMSFRATILHRGWISQHFPDASSYCCPSGGLRES